MFRAKKLNDINLWSGRVALIIGCGSGIGEAIAKELVKYGLKVVVADRKVENIECLARELSDAEGKLYCLKAELSNESEIFPIFYWVKTNLGGVDILINNYCVFDHIMLTDFSTQALRRTFNANVLLSSMCSAEAIKSMREKNIDDGHIIYINSVVGDFVKHLSGVHAYLASRSAVSVLAEGLQRELVKNNSNVKVSTMTHGPIETEFLKAAIQTHPDLQAEPILKSEDVAQSIVNIIGTSPDVQISELKIS